MENAWLPATIDAMWGGSYNFVVIRTNAGERIGNYCRSQGAGSCLLQRDHIRLPEGGDEDDGEQWEWKPRPQGVCAN